MAKMYTTAKVNPLTGFSTDNNPKKEARQERRQVRREEKALNKSLNEGIKKQGKAIKQYYKSTEVEEMPKPKDWRDKAKADKGGKKGSVVRSGRGGRVNYKKMDESCKKPN